MIFVPSHNGRSHSPQEYTASADLVAGASALLHSLLALGYKIASRQGRIAVSGLLSAVLLFVYCTYLLNI